LVIVKVPFVISSGVSFFVRAFAAISLIALARPLIFFSSAFLILGTISPAGSTATAIPRLINFFLIIVLPSIEEFTSGYSLNAFTLPQQ
jgi:hypothetical protein